MSITDGMGQAWGRLSEDFHRNPGVWIGVGVSAAVLIMAYLAYRSRASSAGTQTPANGYGQPDWATALAGDAPGAAPGNAELQNEINAIYGYLTSTQTPNSPSTAAPSTTSATSGGTSGGNVLTRMASAVSSTFSGSSTKTAAAQPTATVANAAGTGKNFIPTVNAWPSASAPLYYPAQQQRIAASLGVSTNSVNTAHPATGITTSYPTTTIPLTQRVATGRGPTGA